MFKLWHSLSPNSHWRKTARWLKGRGVEIGALGTPIAGIKPIYVDMFAEYAGKRCLADYYGEATALPFWSNSLDYVASSHVFEHCANPVQALYEWYRVLRPGGMIYMVVPDRRYTFDHWRAPTPVEHMLEDYLRGAHDHEATHLDEFVDNLDWQRFEPSNSSTPEEISARKAHYRRLYYDELAAGRAINIHFHVFEPSNLLALFEALVTHPALQLRLQVVDSAERFPVERGDGFLVVARCLKQADDQHEALENESRALRDARYPLLPTARKME